MFRGRGDERFPPDRTPDRPDISKDGKATSFTWSVYGALGVGLRARRRSIHSRRCESQGLTDEPAKCACHRISLIIRFYAEHFRRGFARKGRSFLSYVSPN